MRPTFPTVYLARHGETAWSRAGRHTGRTDLPLTDRGEQDAHRLGERLAGVNPVRVFTSPLRRAARTCELAGFGGAAAADPDLVEWDYGEIEGKTTAEARAAFSGWELFRDGALGGESVADVAARADRVVARLREVRGGDALVFSSGHFLRVLAARWCGLDAAWGRVLVLGTAAVCALGYDHAPTEPVIRLWNDARHTGD